ncbi:MAG: response regulator transcription factor [Halobacteriota archaeon]
MEYRILIVDDEEAVHTLLSLFLARNDQHTFSVYSAGNGEVGVQMYSKLSGDGQKPDLVLMDLRMPVMDGVEATIRIKDNDPGANIYLFTAYANTDVERKALDAGAKGTIRKAADWTITIDEIVNILDK